MRHFFYQGPLNAIFVISEADETGEKDGGKISRAGATQWLKRDSDEQRKQHTRGKKIIPFHACTERKINQAQVSIKLNVA